MDVANYVNDKKHTPGYRCNKCGKLLAEGEEHKVEIRCNRCGTLNKILEKMTEQVIVTDVRGTILFVNGEVERITGYSAEEAIGKTPSLWGGQMPPEFYKTMWSTLVDEKQGVSVKVTNRHKSGYLYDALLRVSPVLDSQGKIELFVGFESLVAKHPPQ